MTTDLAEVASPAHSACNFRCRLSYFCFMIHRLIITAQVPADPNIEITAGGVVSALIVLSTLTASLVMIVIWIVRWNDKREIMPAARRKPLRAPLPLTICGILLAGMMALMALGGPAETNAGTDGASAAANAGENNEEESGEDQNSSAEQGIAESETDQSEPNTGDGPHSDDAGKKATESNFMAMLLSTLFMNAMIFTVFGLTILLLQQLQTRKLNSDGSLTYDPLIPGQQADTYPRNSQFPDLNPDQRPEEWVTERLDARRIDAPPNPFIDDNDSHQTDKPEPWRFKTEARFAFETFLAAYLPTAILRILITVMLPESPSHPFLEMMDEGISWTIVGLIAFMAVFVAPIVEELLYRVTILGGLMQQQSLLAGWVVSSVLFGFAHGFPDSIALLPLAFAIGYTYMRRRSYRTVVLVHFMFNAFNMTIAGIAML